MGSNATGQALCYLAAWERGVALDGDLAFAERLQAAQLDYSWSSLARIDALLDTLRAQLQPEHKTFLQQQANINFLLLLAFYVGEVRARLAGEPARWEHWNELIERDPGMRMFGEGFHSAVVQTAPGVFLPLVSIMARLFEGPEDKSVAFSAGMHLSLPDDSDAPLPVLPAQSLVPNLADALQTLNASQHQGYTAQDWGFLHLGMQRLVRIREALPRLLDNGRIVWAAIVQANSGVLRPGAVAAAPAEILYDPRGLMPPDTLADVAGRLFRLKGTQPENAALREYADHLAAETTALFAWQTPPELTPYPLLSSSFCIRTTLLPGERVVSRVLPIMVSDDEPGIAIIAPWGLWPREFYNDWCDAIRRHDPEANPPAQDAALLPTAAPDVPAGSPADVQQELHAEHNYQEGLRKWRSGSDQAGALRYWLLAAQADDLRALETLAWLTLRETMPDLIGNDSSRWSKRAQAVARDRTGLLNAGRLMLREDRVDSDYFDMRADMYLRMANDVGLREAGPLLEMLRQRRGKQTASGQRPKPSTGRSRISAGLFARLFGR